MKDAGKFFEMKETDGLTNEHVEHDDDGEEKVHDHHDMEPKILFIKKR